MQLLRSTTYRADLEIIVDYIARDSPAAALKMWEEIETQVEMLKLYQDAGRPGRVEGTRELVISRTPFIVAYRKLGDAVCLVRVLHGAQQWPKQMPMR